MNKLIKDERLYRLCRVWFDWWSGSDDDDLDNVKRHAYNSCRDGDRWKCVLPNFHRMSCLQAAAYVGGDARKVRGYEPP